MLEIKKRLIDKKYVHKSKQENVLIFNVRRALPLKINTDVLKNIILPKLSQNEKELLLKYYILHKDTVSNNKQKDDEAYYTIYNIPHLIEEKNIKELFNKDKFTKEELETILSFYHEDEKKENYVLKEDITEMDEMKIQNLMKIKNLHVIDYDNRGKISQILEKIDDFKKDNIFYANMFADKEHSFFFEHEVDHVPALMLIEASRQFLIACCHLYGKIPLEGISFILSGIQIEFKNFLNLNFPTKMIAKVNKVKTKKEGAWKNEIDATITFYQRNIDASTINYIGKIIKNNSFKTLRKDQFKYKEQPRFNPSGMFYNNISIRDNNMKKYLCKITDISEKGFKLKFNDPVYEASSRFFDFFIFFQEVGFVHGKCELKWHKKNEEIDKEYLYIGGFIIKEIVESDIVTLKEAIKRFCYIKTERNFL
ncbi:MAG: hypothetical protein KAT05_11105 [Spirochaetes bacterium]|nr:hypothetical protein [Spirochaetota bacterium]